MTVLAAVLAATAAEAMHRYGQLSNSLVKASMAVYTCAMLAHALYAARQVRTPARPAAVEQLQPVGVAAGPGSSSVPDLEPQQPSQPQSRSEQRVGHVALNLTILAALVLTAAVAARVMAVHRPPWGNMYEFSLTSALLATLIYVVAAIRWRVVGLGVVVVPLALLGVGLAATVLYVPAGGLQPILDSSWLVIHVATVVGSFAAYTVGAALCLLYLARASSRPSWAGRLGWLPSAQRLDTMSYRLHAFTFPVYTFSVIAGAIWAEAAWGRYWGWDPKETWAFIVWVLYAIYLHARLTAGWSGRAAAGLALLAYSGFIVNYFVINLLVSGLHSYAR